ncbi:hypothetical protein J2S34_000624 [Nitrobacter winogradskyi]|uniref:Uncharacterized protein n=1 Tax=Nitrobacter winogradskyi TaxID=913 RepID=A0ACC6AFB6_NITWI|nr:hypothetical protein [Nitrobacter winogradskyi]
MNAGQQYFVVTGSKASAPIRFAVRLLAVQSISAKHVVGGRAGMQGLLTRIVRFNLIGSCSEAREAIQQDKTRGLEPRVFS